MDEEHARALYHTHELRLSKIEAILEDVTLQIIDLEKIMAAKTAGSPANLRHTSRSGDHPAEAS